MGAEIISEKEAEVISVQPTIIYERPEQKTPPVSQAEVGLVAGSGPRFADETAELLRIRLLAATVVLAVVLGLAFLGNLLYGVTSLWWLRVLTWLVPVGCVVILRTVAKVTLLQLRLLELAAFGAVVFQLALILVTRTAEFVATNDAVSLVSTTYQLLTAWCILILVYGIFMPNNWQRGAAVMIPMSLIPYLVFGIQRIWLPDIGKLLDENRSTLPVPPTIVCALISTYGAHIINTARRDAFKARRLGQYRLLDRLGGGGMGDVYKAEHMLLKRPCAIKLIKTECEADANAIAHFEREVQATARLTHWNTIEIYDYGHADDGTFYYVMELLWGLSLEELVAKHGPLPAPRVVHLLRQICGALSEAHGAGLIHRDIKPANIFAARRGGIYDVAKLLDFGLVKENTDSTGSGGAYGSFSVTPLYMSPEQASAYESVDGRADIYSLGAVAYELLTGGPPFAGHDIFELLAAHARSKVVPPSACRPDIPTDVEQVILKCLAKRADERYQSAAELERSLASCRCADQWSAQEAAVWWQSNSRGYSGNSVVDK